MESKGRSPYTRVVLKLSGEALGGGSAGPFEEARGDFLADEIAGVCTTGIQLAVVIGAGNIIRGRDIVPMGVAPVTADAAGMFATVINGLVLSDVLDRVGVGTAVFTALGASPYVPAYAPAEAARCLAEGKVVICAGGTGNPFFTTDTAAALRAAELGADALLKGTKVDGVYSADPAVVGNAKRFDHLSYRETIDRRLAMMDLAAVSMCEANRIPVVVFNVFEKGNLLKVVQGRNIGTLVSEDSNGH